MTIIGTIIRTPEKPVKDVAAFRSNIIQNFMEYFNEKISEDLENAILDYSFKEAERDNVQIDWENPEFIRIYLDKFREIYLSCNTHTIQPLIYGDATVEDIVENGL